MHAEQHRSSAHGLRGQALAAQREVSRVPVLAGQPVEVRACPGAGKTRAIVDRHLMGSLPARQGRAIVSFTKAVGRELRRRCAEAGRSDLADFPHFLGTIDGFLWLHLVRPYLSTLNGKRHWRRLESWEGHPGARKGEVTLEDFSFAMAGDLRTGAATLRESARFRARGQDVQALEWWAHTTHLDLLKEGYLTADLVRDLALRFLADEHVSEHILSVLTARFTELIVDEAQDCAAKDRAILRTLVDRGLPLMLVGDPDQAIYGFRDTDAAGGRSGTVGAAHTVELRHNWRSSQTICDLAATLRGSRRAPDTAVGELSGEASPILLVPLPEHGADHVRAFCAEADRLGIPAAERFVVAHWRSSLPRHLTGAPRPPQSSIGQIAWAVGVLRAPAAPTRQREKAAEVVRAHILDVWCGPDGLPVADRLERHGVETRGIERAQALVLRDLPDLERPMGEWKALAQEVFGRHTPDQERTVPVGGLRWARRHAPTDAKPAYEVGGHGTLRAMTPVEVGKVTTVHQVKGEEADAVLVVVPEPTPRNRSERMVSSWTGGAAPVPDESAEDLNVLYVAATRARRLLAFALCDSHLPWVEAFLEERGIPSRVVG
jgi:hypothetical protein